MMKFHDKCLFLICFLFATVSASPSNEAESSFALSLVEEKECYRAITEFLRLIHDKPFSPNVVDWKMNMLGCYSRAEDYDGFFRWTSRWLPDTQVIDSVRAPLLVYSVQQALDIEEYGFILGLKSRHLVISDSVASRKFARGYILSQSGTGQDSLAIANAKELFPLESSFIDALVFKSNFKPKSKIAGRIYSLFPGGGYLYAERYGTSFASLAIIGLLTYGIYESLEQKQNSLAIMLGIVNFAWYSGSISVSSKMVEDWNLKKKREFSVTLKRFY